MKNKGATFGQIGNYYLLKHVYRGCGGVSKCQSNRPPASDLTVFGNFSECANRESTNLVP